MKRIKTLILIILCAVLWVFTLAGCAASYVRDSFNCKEIVYENGGGSSQYISFDINFNRPGRYNIKYVLYTVNEKGEEAEYMKRQKSVFIDKNNLGEYTVHDTDVFIFAKPETVRIRDLEFYREPEAAENIITAFVIGAVVLGVSIWLVVLFIKSKNKERRS